MRKPKPKKGISTMLAVIILIIIMLAASLLVFAYFSSFFGNTAKNCEVLVLNPKLYCDLQGQNAFVTFTVKNVGSQPVTNLTLTVRGVAQQLEVSDSDPIFPGKSRGFRADLPGTYVVGDRYAYSISAIDVNGNSFALTNTLMCSWYTGTGEQAKVDFTTSPLASEDTKRWILNPAPSIVADTDWAYHNVIAGVTSEYLGKTIEYFWFYVYGFYADCYTDDVSLISLKSPGEQIINGGFEDGTTGWFYNYATIQYQSYRHSGDYSVQLQGFLIEEPYIDRATIVQDNINVAVDKVQSFGVWIYANDTYEDAMSIMIIYTDGSESVVDRTVEAGWHYHDFMPLLSGQEGKTILLLVIGDFIDVVDVYMYVDDVSLISLSYLGEQIINGGFETEDFTGWSINMKAPGSSTISSSSHSGNYSARLQTEAYLSQYLAASIKVSDIQTFGFWYKVVGPEDSYLAFCLYFTDGSYQELQFYPTFSTPQRYIIQEQDLFWVFYSYEENLVYKTSSNGKVWSNAVVIRPCETGGYFSVWYDGANLHYVYAKPEYGESMFYRSGGLGADGNITWNAPEQEVLTSSNGGSDYSEDYSYFFMPFVSVDSAGYPWISYGYYLYHYDYSPYGGDEYYEYTASVVKSSTKDGTWTQDFSYDLNTGDGDWMTSILPLTDEKMIAIYTRQSEYILSQVWDGATWHLEQTSFSINERFWSAVTWGDNAYLVCAGYDGESSLGIFYSSYSFTADSWSSNFALGFINDRLAPQLCIDPTTGDVYCFWITSNFEYDQLEPNILYFKKYTAATATWDAEPIIWVACTPYHGEISCSYSLEEGRIGCVWEDNSPTTETLYFNFLGTVPTEPSGIILTVDGVDYNYQDLPISFSWQIGSTHQFAWKPIVGVSESTYQWNATSGLSTEEQGSLVPTSGGEVTATYKLKLGTEVIVSANGFNDLSAVSNSTVLTVDDTDYTVSEIPTAFFWDPGSSHVFSWRDKITEAGPYYWIKTFGVSASRLGTLTTPNGFGALFAIYEERPEVNFSAVGVPTSNEDYVITIDGDLYTTGNLTSQQWPVGSTHTFEWHDTVMISGTPYVFLSSSGLSTQEADTLTIPSGGGSITAIYLEGAAVTFNVQNLPNNTQGLVLSLDSVDYYYNDLPYVFIGNVNSSHTFQWISPVVDSLGNSYSWVSTTGGLVTAQSGVLVLNDGGGNVTATYQQLTLVRTDEVSQITGSSATLNGALTSGTCDQRGFDWGTQWGPGEEQIINGGFETGDFTGWTLWNQASGSSIVTDEDKHSGTYSAKLGLTAEYEARIIQVISPSIMVNNMESFGVWLHVIEEGVVPACIWWYWDEGGYNREDYLIPLSNEWTYVDFKAHLIYMGKGSWHVNKLWIQKTFSYQPFFVDDVSLIPLTKMYSNEWTESGSFGLGSFSHSINTTEGVTYYFRAKAHGLSGWIYGDEKSFSSEWLTGWNYRKSHMINAASGAGTYYQIRINVYYGTGSDSDGNIYLSGKCRTDFGDVRFTDNDQTTLLDYWMESKIDSDNAVFWVEVADDLSVAQTIYVYYGKADATTTSSQLDVNIFQLRAQKTSGDNPDVSFSKSTSTKLRISGGGYWSMGYCFIVVPRAWLNGKYLRWNWNGYWGGGADRTTAAIWIYDGDYSRKTDADFPQQWGPLTKGAGLLQGYGKNAHYTWGPETVDLLINVASGTQDKCTIFFVMYNAWQGYTLYVDWDWVEINTASGGGGNLFTEHFLNAVVMEKTGSTGDYGLYRKYVSPEPSYTGLNTVVGSSQVSTNSPYRGTYCAFLSVIPSARCEIVQNFATPVMVSAIASFSLWVKRVGVAKSSLAVRSTDQPMESSSL